MNPDAAEPPQPTTLPPDAPKIVAELAARLTRSDSLEHPFIVEGRVGPAHARHVTVIWDRWTPLQARQRSEVIRQAYEAAGVLQGDRLSVAKGFTHEEALELGYLPVRIESTCGESDEISPAQVREAMASAGGVLVRRDEGAAELRFVSMNQARAAYRRLCQQLSGPYWAIVEEVGAPGA